MKKENKEYQENFKVLQRISIFTSSIKSLQKLLTLIMEESRTILNAEASSLLLYDRDEKVLFFKVATGEKGSKVKTVKLKIGQGIAGECARKREIINVSDASRDKRFFSSADKKTRFKTRSVLAIPLTGKNRKLLGVLEVLNKKDGKPFNKKDEELMEIIAGQASLSIENAQLYIESVKNARMAGVAQTMLALSHDIKNIVNGLSGGISIMDCAVDTVEDPYAIDAWDIVKTNVNRISDLILDMLNYSSKKKPLLQEISLDDFIRETVSVYREKLMEKGVEVRYDFDKKIGIVQIDAEGMQRALLNLFANAYEAVNAGEGRIEILTKTLPKKSRYSITVADNGGGIPAEKLKNIFDVFFTTKGQKGTGLGLAVVKKIVKEHGGSVEVSSQEGEGTAFTLTLPV